MVTKIIFVIRKFYIAPVVLCALFGATACVDLEQIIFSGKNRFQSDFPSETVVTESGKGVSIDGDNRGTVSPATSSNDKSPKTGSSGTSDKQTLSPERAIEEADVVQIDGNKLYALSRWSGLSIIDLSTRDKLRILGHFDNIREAEPFEMYIRDQVVLIMFSGWGEYSLNEDTSEYSYVQTSKVLALDVTDPAAIQQVGSFDIPGSISDSRVVGDVAYIVGYQNGDCWRCQQNQPLTSVVSLDIANPRQIKKVDELRYFDDDNEWGWNRRSIAVTTERIYVAGIEYGQNGPVGSTIKVVDITDPLGYLAEGADIQAAGQVSSRWQMDEYEGVLRVISQPPQWDLSMPPAVQTFRMISSKEVAILGKTELKLPRPEQLQSVRFDGPRAYAVSFERVDPLFTIDLSDPALPIQKGELEMPGFLYYMEPRGDRLIGLGFDQGSELGAITVSLFNVSDLSQPTMIGRVNFGGNWAWLSEDQDRIHKVFRVFDEIGLILVPYSGSANSTDACRQENNGVQLVDFTKDSLKLRGNATSTDETRRALLHDSRLLTVSDQSVRAFNIDDRDRPIQTASLTIAQYVSRMVPLSSGVVARISESYGSGIPTIDFVPQADVEKPEAALSTVSLADALGTESGCHSYFSIQETFVEGNALFILYQTERTTADSYAYWMGVMSIDAGDASNPRILSNVQWDLGPDWWIEGASNSYGLEMPWTPAVRTRNAIAFTEASYYNSETEQSYDTPRRRFRIVDISDPAQLQAGTLAIADTDTYSSILAEGDLLLVSRYEPIENNRDAVRFYLDRIDLSEPARPRRLLPVNIPGSMVSYDSENLRALTSDLLRVETLQTTQEACSAQFANYKFADDDWNTPEGTCTGYRMRIHLVSIEGNNATLVNSYQLPENRRINGWNMGEDVLFAALGTGNYYGGPRYYCKGTSCGGSAGQQPQEILVLSGFSGDSLDATVTAINAQGWSGWSWAPRIYASGKRATVVGDRELAVLNAVDPQHPAVEMIEPYYSGYISDLDMTSNAILLSLGTEGAQLISLSQ